MSNVTSFAAYSRKRSGPVNMRAELERRHAAEWARIEAGDRIVHERVMARVSAVLGADHVPGEDPHGTLMQRLDALR